MKAATIVYSVILVVGSFLSSYSLAGTFDLVENKSCLVTASNRVKLRGSLSVPVKRSISQPIEVFQEEKVLNIYYLSDLGKIEITVSNAEGNIVYCETVSATKGTNYSINMNDQESGDYTIKFKDNQGAELYGVVKI